MTNDRTVHLFSDDLLSKWGFSDGDVLSDPLYDLADERGLNWTKEKGLDKRAVLIRAVKEYLLPALDQRVEVETLLTSHNPIRATKIDGVEVDVLEDDTSRFHLTPEYVEVPLEVLYGWWIESGRERD